MADEWSSTASKDNLVHTPPTTPRSLHRPVAAKHAGISYLWFRCAKTG